MIAWELTVKSLWWMLQNFSNEESTLVQLMAWCHQATSHYLGQCWSRCMTNMRNIKKCMISIDFHSARQCLKSTLSIMVYSNVAWPWGKYGTWKYGIPWTDQPKSACFLLYLTCRLTRMGSQHATTLVCPSSPQSYQTGYPLSNISHFLARP